MPERYPNTQSSSTVKSAKSFKPSKFEQLKSWIGTEQEANRSKNIRVTETGVTPIKEITQKALTKLRSTIDSKSFKKVVKGIAATGAVLMMNLGHVNPVEAKSNVKVESSPTNIEQVVTQVVNNDVSSPKAQKLKKDFGFEKVSDTDYSKMLKATYSSSESKYDVQKLKIESETKGIQNPDGTLNRQRAVNKLHLKYLQGIEPMTAPTIGENTTGSTKIGQGKETKANTSTPTTAKEIIKKYTTTKPAEVKPVTSETKTPTKETSKTIMTEAILESGKINLDSPAVQKLKAHLGLNDLADDQQFKKFNDFVKTNITKGEGTATLKNSAIEDYLKAHPTRPVAPKPDVKPTPITTPTPKDPTAKPEAVPSPVPSVTETKPSPSPVESLKPSPTPSVSTTIPSPKPQPTETPKAIPTPVVKPVTPVEQTATTPTQPSQSEDKRSWLDKLRGVKTPQEVEAEKVKVAQAEKVKADAEYAAKIKGYEPWLRSHSSTELEKQGYIKFIDSEIAIFITENKLSENQAKYFGKFTEKDEKNYAIQKNLQAEFESYLIFRKTFIERGNRPNSNTDVVTLIGLYKSYTLKVLKTNNIN